jgi:hypothetical protein
MRTEPVTESVEVAGSACQSFKPAIAAPDRQPASTKIGGESQDDGETANARAAHELADADRAGQAYSWLRAR